MRLRHYVAASVAATALVLVSAPFSAISADDPYEPVIDRSTVTPSDLITPDFDRRNLEAVQALDSEGQCLFRNSIYPQSPALKADEFGPWEVAADVLRAEILRNYSHEVSGVSFTYDQSGNVLAATVHAVAGSKAASLSVEELLQPLGPKFDKAWHELRASNIRVEIAGDAVQALQRGCALEDEVHDGTLFKALGTEGFGLSSGVDETSGVLEITVPKEWLTKTQEWVAQYEVATKIRAAESEIKYTGRGTAYVPKFGGSFLKNTTNTNPTSYCSNAFRINTTALLTAGHCGYFNWYSTHVQYTTYSGTTSSSYSLTSVGIDSMLLYGSTYSNRVWMGDALGQSTIPSIGFLTESQIVMNGYYLASNGLTGQGTFIMTNKWQTGTFKNDLTGTFETRHHLYFATAAPGFWTGCTSGDSGSPWMLYVPNGASYPAIATMTGTHGAGCAATSVAAISYLYGGASIG